MSTKTYQLLNIFIDMELDIVHSTPPYIKLILIDMELYIDCPL